MKKIILILFILSTSFFLFQHFYESGYLWDFYSYELNARHWFFNGKYYEPFRPPLMPFILGILGANVISEYIYIILVSALFAYSSIRLARSLKLNEIVFYGLSLNLFVLLEGLFNGTELLSLSLIELMLAFVFENREDVGGIFYSLASLARYNFLTYFIFLFPNFNWKKIAKGIVFAILIFSPWLIYNKIVYGNYFLGIIDSYAMNYYYRSGAPSFKISHFLYATNFLLPIFVLGLTKFKNKKEDWIFILIFVLSIFQYITIPLKCARYLFPITLPLVYFSMKIKWKKEYVILFFLLSLIIATASLHHSDLNSYKRVIKQIEMRNLNCSLDSNVWIYFNYLGYPTSPEINEKDMVIISKGAEYDKNALKGFKHLFEFGNFEVYANNCTKHNERYDQPYIILKASYLKKKYNETRSTNPCDYIPLSNLCKLVNEI